METSCRNVGVLKVAHEQDPNISVVQVHCSGRWLLAGELLSGMKCAGSSGGLRHISRLAIDGGAAAGQTQPRPTVMVHTPSATPQPLKPTPIFIWFDKCILTAFVKT